MPIAGEGKIAN